MTDVLAGVPLFSNLSKKELTKLARDVLERTFPAGVGGGRSRRIRVDFHSHRRWARHGVGEWEAGGGPRPR